MNVRISQETHSLLREHLPEKIKIGPWVDEAILEKICKENPEIRECKDPVKPRTRNTKHL